jgi:hypothetical protein
MLLAFPDFFSSTSSCCCACCTSCCAPDRARTAPVPATYEVRKNCYYQLAKVLTRLPASIIVPFVVYGLMGWGASALGELSLSLGVQFTASNTSAAQAYAPTAHTQCRSLSTACVHSSHCGVCAVCATPEYGRYALVQQTAPFAQSGIFASPFAILAQPAAGTVNSSGLFTDDCFTSACSLAHALADVPGLVPFSLQGIAFSLSVSPEHGPQIACRSAADALALIHAADAPYLYTLRQLSNVPVNATTADYLAATASAVTFSPGFNPFTSRSVTFVDDLYAVIDAAAVNSSLTSLTGSSQVAFSLFHPVVAEVAAEQYTVQRLPWGTRPIHRTQHLRFRRFRIRCSAHVPCATLRSSSARRHARGLLRADRPQLPRRHRASQAAAHRRHAHRLRLWVDRLRLPGRRARLAR